MLMRSAVVLLASASVASALNVNILPTPTAGPLHGPLDPAPLATAVESLVTDAPIFTGRSETRTFDVTSRLSSDLSSAKDSLTDVLSSKVSSAKSGLSSDISSRESSFTEGITSRLSSDLSSKKASFTSAHGDSTSTDSSATAASTSTSKGGAAPTGLSGGVLLGMGLGAAIMAL